MQISKMIKPPARSFPSNRIIVKYLFLFLLVTFVVYILYGNHDATPTVNLENSSDFIDKQSTVRKNEHTAYFDDPNRNKEEIKIDWHNYKQIAYEAQRTGLGEQGREAVLTRVDDVLQKAIYHANGYNGYLSDQISLNRSVADTRHPNCKHKHYLADLPTVSAIVPFWNEHFSTLLRTAQSMLNRAPPQLLLEVILVNDFSDIGFTWTELNDHVMEHYGDRVKVIHSKERIGLMAARTAGARIAKGDVLVFVDAHTEANVNWLPPLVEPIALNYRTVTVPYVDSVDVDKFAYRENDRLGHRGIFDWKFLYHQLYRKPEDIKDPIEPFQTPVMNGGLFAISAKWFWELGGYDEGLDVWGGEQFEISFKLWQCGGEMYDIPCSRFGHVFRRGGKEFKNPRNFEFLYRNYKRVAEVWMDDYKQHIYSRRPELFASIDAGDLTKPKAIRQQLNCKSFQWYLDEIATEVLTTYPPVVPFFTSGAIHSLGDQKLCVDTLGGTFNKRQLGLRECSGTIKDPIQHQRFQLTYYRDIEYEHELCFDASISLIKGPIVLLDCHNSQGNQYWRYDPTTKMILKDKLGTVCLDCNPEKRDLFVDRCDKTNKNQKWEWGFVNQTMVDNWEKSGTKLL